MYLRRFANYGKFKIGGPSEGYKLTIRGFDETLKGKIPTADFYTRTNFVCR